MSDAEFTAFAEKEKAEIQLAKKKELLDRWNNLPRFDEVHQVPILPQVDDPREWSEFYVKKLISSGAIPKEALKDGEHYVGSHRRAQVARWNSEMGRFEYWRTKFNQTFIDYCNHFEDDDGFSLFVPIGTASKDQFEKNEI